MDVQRNEVGQLVVLDLGDRHAVAVDSAYDVDEVNRRRDVIINGSYSGVLPARFIAEKHPLGAIGLDCAVGPAGAAIAGLWYLEALEIPAATADVRGVILGDGADLWTNGRISFLNQPARDLGVSKGDSVESAARAMLTGRAAGTASPADITNRTMMGVHASGRSIVCTDSIAFGRPEDRDRNVLVTAGHAGRSAVPYLEKMRPYGFICSDGGMGRDCSGVAALAELGAQGVAGATVDARTACMGDALSSWATGIISAVNEPARARGVFAGMSCRQAAELMVAGMGEEEGSMP